MNKQDKILFLAPHTDDIEFGCGGTIAKFAQEQKQIFAVAFSAAEESVPSGLDRDINRKNMFEALKILGVNKENCSILNFKVREFPQNRQLILDEILRIKKEIEPDMVFLPSTFDTHQDHQVISNEGFRAFKKTTLIGYEIPWNNLTFTTNMFVKISESEMEKKLESIRTYISQLGRSYLDDDFIRSLARTRGGQSGFKYAEAFEIIRWIIH